MKTILIIIFVFLKLSVLGQNDTIVASLTKIKIEKHFIFSKKRIYNINDSLKLFSGTIYEQKKDNNLNQDCFKKIRNGKIISSSLVTYYEGGQIHEKYSITGKKMKKFGLYESWYLNGVKNQSGFYKAGQKTGYWEIRDENGNSQLKKYIKNVSEYEDHNWVIKFAPITLFDYRHPSIQLGMERLITKSFAIQAEYGYILPKSIIEHYDFYSPNFNGYRARGELKYYYFHNDKENKYGPYCSVEFYKTKNNYQAKLGLCERADSVYHITHFDDLKIYKNLYGANLKCGYQRNFNRFVVDVAAGMGVQHQIIDVTGRTNMNDKLVQFGKGYNFTYNLLTEPSSKNRYAFKLALNIKIGYLF